MATPPTIRVNVGVPFPSLVAGAAGIVVEKINGVWTIRPDFTAFAVSVPASSQYPNTLIQAYNTVSGVYSTITLTLLASAASAVTPTIVTAAGDYAVLAADTDLLIEKTVAAANRVMLPTAASRNGSPIFIKDGAGNAADFNITIRPSGAETIDGLPIVEITANYGGIWLFPRPSGSVKTGWFIKP